MMHFIVAILPTMSKKDFEEYLVISNSTNGGYYDEFFASLRYDTSKPIHHDLYFEDEDHLVEQIRIAIKSGNHIILIGPPGTGKSKMAKAICESMRGPDNYIMVTACSDWSTFDTIGGYMPNEQNELIFDKGIFLSCFQNRRRLPDNKWLILDEINRADIDKAFGALFSALTGDRIYLSQAIDNERIEIIGDPKDGEEIAPKRFFIHDDWRIIATMNSFDKASLYEMSYAFMRRFAFINIGFPEDLPLAVSHLFQKWDLDIPDENMIRNISDLWAVINKYRRIGPAIVKDIAHCVIEGGSFGSAVTMYVLPQFEGLMQDEQIKFIRELKTSGLVTEDDYASLIKIASDFFEVAPGKFDNAKD
jgi:MoxR-like ATPase